MLLNYYGYVLTLADFRTRFGATGRDGLTAKDLVRIARGFGLNVRSFSLEQSDLSGIKLPAIVHWQFNHFLVVESQSQSKSYLTVLDPTVGRRKLTRQEFDAGFTGVILTFEPNVKGQKRQLEAAHSSWQPTKAKKATTGFEAELFGQLLTEKKLLVGLILAGILLQATAFLPALLLKHWLERLFGSDINPTPNQPNLLWLIGAGLTLGVGFFSLYGLRAGLLTYLSARLDKRLGETICDRLLKQPYPFFERYSSGELLNRLQSLRIVRELLTGQFLTAGLDAFLLLAFVILVYTQSAVLGLTVTLIGLLQLGVSLVARPHLKELTQSELSARSRLETFQNETLSGILNFKAGGASANQGIVQQWSTLRATTIRANLAHSCLTAPTEAFSTALRLSTPVVILAVGSLQTSLSPGTLVALNALSLLALGPLTSLLGAVKSFGELKIHCGRLSELVSIEGKALEVDNTSRAKIKPSGKIEVHNLSFRHTPYSPFVLQNINLKITPGQKVAIVGASGSGKSTLAKLLLGLYQPTEGEIYYDEQLTSDLDLAHLQEQIGIVLQESSLSNTSLRENVVFYRSQLTLEDITAALATTGLADFVRKLPLGYETRLGEGGSSLSGGQRQRLLIARALVRRPSILLLDEATSQLDALTEAALLARLAQLDCTQIVIAHRLSAIKSADRIIVLDGGRIVQSSSHEELISKEGKYRELYVSQSQDKTR